MAIHEHAAAVAGRIAGDDAAGHRERAAAVYVHAAAAAGHDARGEAVGEREVAAGTDIDDAAVAVVRDRVSVQVERDGVRDRQGRVAVRRDHVVRERHRAARIEQRLQQIPRHERTKAKLAVRVVHDKRGIVAEETRLVARSRARGERDGRVHGRRVLCRHADGRVRRKAVHGDRASVWQIDVVRRADGVGVAVNDGTAGDGERAVHVHAAAVVRHVARDGAAGHRERAVRFHAAGPVGGVVRDRAAGHRERAAPAHAHAAAHTGRVAGDFAAGHRERAVHFHAAAEVGVAAGDGPRGFGAVGEREVAAVEDLDDAKISGGVDHMTVQVERDGVRDRQRPVDRRRRHVVRERHDAARVELRLQPIPRRRPFYQAQFAVHGVNGESGIVARETRGVGRRRAGGERDGLGRGRLGTGRHADGCVRRQVAHGDRGTVDIDVVRRAVGAGVAGNEGAARNRERLAHVHKHAAAVIGRRVA